jgi:hypothetical protein
LKIEIKRKKQAGKMKVKSYDYYTGIETITRSILNMHKTRIRNMSKGLVLVPNTGAFDGFSGEMFDHNIDL